MYFPSTYVNLVSSQLLLIPLIKETYICGWFKRVCNIYSIMIKPFVFFYLRVVYKGAFSLWLFSLRKWRDAHGLWDNKGLAFPFGSAYFHWVTFSLFSQTRCNNCLGGGGELWHSKVPDMRWEVVVAGKLRELPAQCLSSPFFPKEPQFWSGWQWVQLLGRTLGNCLFVKNAQMLATSCGSL